MRPYITVEDGEDMVVKPLTYIAYDKLGFIRPAVKVREKEYLKIIYGPDYEASNHRERLKQRDLG